MLKEVEINLTITTVFSQATKHTNSVTERDLWGQEDKVIGKQKLLKGVTPLVDSWLSISCIIVQNLRGTSLWPGLPPIVIAESINISRASWKQFLTLKMLLDINSAALCWSMQPQRCTLFLRRGIQATIQWERCQCHVIAVCELECFVMAVLGKHMPLNGARDVV